MANSCLFFLDFYYCLLSTLCRGQLAPCTPRRAEPARPQSPAARIRSPFFLISPYQKAVLYIIAQDGFLWSSILDDNRICKKEFFTSVRPDGYFHRHWNWKHCCHRSAFRRLHSHRHSSCRRYKYRRCKVQRC